MRESYKFNISRIIREIKSRKDTHNEIRKPNHQISSINQPQCSTRPRRKAWQI